MRQVKAGATLRTVTFKYDPFGRRVEKRVEGLAPEVPVPLTTTYLYDGEDIVVQTVSDGTTTGTTHYVHGPGIDEPLARVANGQSTFYHADGLGSIVAISDSSKQIVQRYRYESFGQLTASDPAFANPYTYTGREWDPETGLYYYRARYYDAMEGRFISKDPIGFAGGDVNMYRYVQNNAINNIDPSGLYWFRQSWQTPGVVGREDTLVPPGGPISEFIEKHVPAGYTFGEVHDAFVNFAAPEGSPFWRDLLLNVPSMIPAFFVAFTMEELRAVGILDELDQPPSQETTPCK